MSFWQKLKRALSAATSGETSAPARRTFTLDSLLIESIQELAEQEQRSQEEVLEDLLHFALDRRTADAANVRRWQSLTPREQEVVALVCLGHTNRQIAGHLVISVETVKAHIRKTLQKFDLESKNDLRLALADWDFRDWQDPKE